MRCQDLQARQAALQYGYKRIYTMWNALIETPLKLLEIVTYYLHYLTCLTIDKFVPPHLFDLRYMCVCVYSTHPCLHRRHVAGHVVHMVVQHMHTHGRDMCMDMCVLMYMLLSRTLTLMHVYASGLPPNRIPG